jgi:hypothetical protein
MKTKTTFSEHIKFTVVVISLMTSWTAAIVWLATINQ